MSAAVLETTATELPRLMACIGSRLMPAALPPDHDHAARDEGNAAHWAAKEIFDGRDVLPGMRDPIGYVLTDEMIEFAKNYVGALDCGEMEIETTHGGDNFTVKGRADHIAFKNDHTQTLIVDDFKYGWRIVMPDGNWTLISHAIGWCMKWSVAPRKIVLRIHQPRPYHPLGPVRAWEMSYEQLLDAQKQIALRLSNPTNQLFTTREQCAKCHALANCPAAREASMNAIDATGVAFSDTLPDPVLAHELETLRHAKSVIEDRFDALEELMTHKIEQGGVIPGYALKPRLANRSWLPGLDAGTLSLATGKPLSKPGIVTPAEAKRRGVPDAVIDALTSRARIGLKLERIDADVEARKVLK